MSQLTLLASPIPAEISSDNRQDVALTVVKKWIESECRRQRKQPAKLFGDAIRQSLDEVIDGSRSERWKFDQLEKTEKTYVGTKIEIVVRNALMLTRERPLDVRIEGYPVDIKWSMESKWQIPKEAVGHICMVIGLKNADKPLDAKFCVGVIRCSADRLLLSKNGDGKRCLNKCGRRCIWWIVESEPLKPGFIEVLDEQIRNEILKEKAGQRRVTKFVQLMERQPFPRSAIEFCAQQRDPMRRVRQDGENRLRGMTVLSQKYNRDAIQRLGLPELEKDWYISVRTTDLEAIGLR